MIFKEGDRVVVIDNESFWYGCAGTVTPSRWLNLTNVQLDVSVGPGIAFEPEKLAFLAEWQPLDDALDETPKPNDPLQIVDTLGDPGGGLDGLPIDDDDD